MTGQETNTAGIRIGFIGIGTMGAPMSANLVRKGFTVTLFDSDNARARQIGEALGAPCAATLKALCAEADIVITMLPTSQIVRYVALEMDAGGLAAHLPRGALLIDMSSSDPLASKQLGAALLAQGIDMLDAPVSGAVTRAREGTLTIMLGGNDKAAIERARPVLAAMGQQLFETGSLGSGHAMKALNNAIAATAFAATAEALIAGEQFGLDPAAMIEIINASTGRSFNSEAVMLSEVVEGRFGTGFQLGLMAKDVKIAADLATGLALDLPLVDLVSRRWLAARDQLGASEDFTLAYKSWKAAAQPR